ncbi:MAG: hypothetical protein Q4A44_03300 [Bacteroidales bacterium]|nr:hypothetical protein [Bacteroidales bacterium]
MKKIFALAALLLIVTTACQESAQERFEREAKAFTEQHCPQMIAKDIRLDSVVYSKTENTYHYYYTLSGTLEQQAVNDTTLGAEQRKFLLNGICNDVSTKLEKEAKVTFHYVYRNAKGVPAWDFVFTHDEYANVTPERPETPREKLARETAEFSAKHCPKEIGEGQRLDSLAYNITNNTLTHYYTLAGKHVTAAFMADKKQAIGQKLLSGLQQEKALAEMRKQGVDFAYEFRAAMSGELVLEYRFSPDEYNK